MMRCSPAAGWSRTATSYDACESGHASVDSALPDDTCRNILEWHERWRYKQEEKEETLNPRDRARAQELELSRGKAAGHADKENPLFQELPQDDIAKGP